VSLVIIFGTLSFPTSLLLLSYLFRQHYERVCSVMLSCSSRIEKKMYKFNMFWTFRQKFLAMPMEMVILLHTHTPV